jgi:hypothetical protein
MHLGRTSVAILAAVALLLMAAVAEAFDGSIYPDWKGQWSRAPNGRSGNPTYDPAKPPGLGQQAPTHA